MFSRSIVLSRWLSSRPRRAAAPQVRFFAIRREVPTFRTIPKCPSSTCECSELPELPSRLLIDYKTNLNGTMAPYAEQVLICTGQDDWTSRIEEENSGDNLAADLKELLGRGGTYADPYNNVSITNASFPSSVPGRSEIINTSAYLLPSFKYVPFLPRISFDSVQALVKGCLLPKKLNAAHDYLSPIHRDRLLRSPEATSFLYGIQDVKDVLVLICGHGGRDARCGLYGPVLRDDFEKVMGMHSIKVLKDAIHVPGPSETIDRRELVGTNDGQGDQITARVGLISHIGGHKFAGNVIVYLPPGLKTRQGDDHPLAACGIWYGRVEPNHVDGIVKETILGGNVIQELLRGGIRQGGEILRL